MKVTRFAPLAVALFTVFVFQLALAPAAAMAQSSLKIAIANPARIFSELQETKDLKTSLDAKRDAISKEEFARRQKMKDLQGKRDSLKTDSPAYSDANNALLQASVEFEVWVRTQQASAQADQKIQTMTLYVKITNATSEVAKAKGYDLVLAQLNPEFPENLDAVTVEQLRAMIGARNVLFATPQMDISSDIIAAMDAKYKTGK